MRFVYLHHRVQTSSGTHPMGIGEGGLIPRVKRKLTTHLHPMPRLKMRGTIPPFPQYIHGLVL